MRDSVITAEPLRDFSELWSYIDDEMFKRLGGSSDHRFCLDGRQIWVLLKSNGKIVGFVNFERLNDTLYLVHPIFIRRFGIYAERGVKCAISEVTKSWSGNLTAMIPVGLSANIKLAERCGFSRAGEIPNAFNGENMVIYTRPIK